MPVIMHEDNQSCLTIATGKGGSYERTKHISLRAFFIKELVSSGFVDMVYCDTTEMVADMLTKQLSATDHARHAEKMLNDGCVPVRARRDAPQIAGVNDFADRA